MKEIKDDRNRRRDIPSSWAGRKNQYCENDYTTKCDLQIQCQITNGIFHRTRIKKKSQFIWKHKRPWKAKAVLRKKEWSWRNQPFWLQIIVQNYSHQDSMALAQKQKYRPIEQSRKPRNKPMQLWVPYFWQRRQEYTIAQREPLQ